MKTENASSGTTSGSTSSSGHASSGRPSESERHGGTEPTKPNGSKPDGSKADPALSDADFLARQADDAAKAIARALNQLKTDLAGGANPVDWAKRYPWIAMGAGAVAGFVATTLLVPSKEEQALKKLAAIERALNPAPRRRERPEREGDEANGDSSKDYKPESHGFLSLIAREAIGAVKPAIISLLTAGVTAKAAKPSDEDMEAAAAREDAKQGGADPQ